jgi:hypothetical protein
LREKIFHAVSARVEIDLNRHIERVLKNRRHLLHQLHQVPFWVYHHTDSTL